MPEWLYEAGIGETRAVLVADDGIVEAAIELEEGGPRAGAILAARLGPPVPPAAAIARLEGSEALLSPVPRGVSEGGALIVEIVREAIAEPSNPKRAQARLAPDGALPQPGPSLRERIAETGLPIHEPPLHGPDMLERAGWSELLEQARTGIIDFPGGRLRMSLTPAMTVFDVDGTLPGGALARAGAEAAARAIRCLGIGGSIGIDLPGGDKADRQAAASAIDDILPQPFERTAVNGFGFLQIVRRRPRASLPELLRADPAGAAARALLRLAERTLGAGPRTIEAAPAVIAVLDARPHWLDRLSRGLGAPVRLQARAELPISGGHVAVLHP